MERKAGCKRKRNARRGFTLVELLVVILIISMLAALMAPRVFRGLGKTKGDISRAQMSLLAGAIERFNIDCGRYPDDSVNLNELIEEPEDLAEGKWQGPYVKNRDLFDSWGNEYVYYELGEYNVGSYDLISYGGDGVEGGEGENADIIYE